MINVRVKVKLDKRGLDKVAQMVAKGALPKTQQVFDGVHDTHAGKPVEDVLPVLRSAAVAAGWDVSEEFLRACAEVISEGKQVEVVPAPAGS